MAAVTSRAPIPDFRVLNNGTITPTIGTNGTYARGGTFWVAPTNSTLLAVGANTSTAPSFAHNFVVTTLSTIGGYWPNTAITNNLIRSSEFDNATWVKNGSASVTANATTDPLGTSIADRIIGAAVNDGVQQASSLAAGSSPFVCSFWLNTGGSNTSVSLIIKDQAGSPQSTTNTVTLNRAQWTLYSVSKLFAAATGNVVCELKVNDTTGKTVFAFGAGLYSVNATTSEMGLDWDMPPTIVTGATTLTLSKGLLKFSGAELTTSSAKKTVSSWFFVPTFTNTLIYQDKVIFSLEGAAFALKIRAYLSSGTSNLHVDYDSTIANQNTGDQPEKGKWNNVIVATDGVNGVNNTYLNGQLIHSNATTFSAYAAANFMLGENYSDGSGISSSYNSLIGWSEVFANKALNQNEAQAIYQSQRALYGR